MRVPQAGIVRAGKRAWGNDIKVGDNVSTGDVVMQLYPPTALEVALVVNEVVINRLQSGQKVAVFIPAVQETSPGRIISVSGLGYDKVRHVPGRDTSDPTGIVQFDVVVAMESLPPGLRQGMTAVVTIPVGTPQAGVVVPRAAARRHLDGWQVRIAAAEGGITWQPVTAQAAGDTAIVVRAGLADGDDVLVPAIDASGVRAP